MRQLALDTETTGLFHQDGHRIIEVACVELVNRRLTGNNFHCYINPEREIDVGAFKVHGLSTEFLSKKPLFSEVADELFEYMKGAELIIHNAPFDVGFLDSEFSQIKTSFGKVGSFCDVTDTLVMAKRKHPGRRNNLDALCKRYYVDNSRRDLHGALLDAELLAQVYLAMTGGQSNLFDEEVQPEASIQNFQAVASQESKDRESLRIIRADEKELEVHNAWVTENLKSNED